jgi:DNA invertase Pin-like site-specific DNA recombinase
MKKAVEAILKPCISPAAHRAAGVNLERKKGRGKSRLDPYKEDIEALLRNGSPKNFVAKRYSVSEPTLYNFIEKHRLGR